MPRTIRDNLHRHTITAVMLCLCLALGTAEAILWGRSAPDDLLPLWAMLLLLFYDHFSRPWPDSVSRSGAWGFLLAAAAFMAAGIARGNCPVMLPDGKLSQTISGNAPMVLRNISLALLAISVMLYRNGWRMAARHWLLPSVSLVILPFYELLLLELSFPLRLLSTHIVVAFLRLLSFNILSNGTTLLWQGHELAITDACSGMSLLTLLLLIAYWLVRKTSAPAWQKACWFSLLLLWVLLANTLRLLLTLFGYMLCGEAVFAAMPHFLLGCFFVVTSSLLLWLSSTLLDKNETRQTETRQP